MDVLYEFLRNTSACQALPAGFLGNRSVDDVAIGVKSTLRDWQLIVIMLGLAVFATIIAKSFNYIRKNVYKDKDNLDTDFDAGGKVSIGLTATTIVSQWTWAATLLQSCTVASKYGISGPLWYAAGATIQILLFAMISVQLKIRAPGAKTFLQVIRARFGRRTHVVFCVFGLMTNVIVTAMLMLGGSAVMTNLVQGLSVELATGMVAAVIATYTFIGGLGATFYVSYFNTTIMFTIILTFLAKVYNEPNNSNNPLGSMREVYDMIDCGQAPEGNKDFSFVTIVSQRGLMFGIINIIGNFGTVFVDQSYWQSSVAAKPKQGVWGFLSGGLVWFAVPFTFATTMGLAYIALSVQSGKHLLTEDDVNAGLVAPLVAQKLMGQTGEILIVLLILMAVTSTGSAEVIAVTSILVYDIYQIYLKPYRKVHDANSCILCGKSRGRMANPRDKCKCISMTYCSSCTKDDEIRKESARAIKPEYKCKTHGTYRAYNDYLIHLKNWCLLCTVLSIVPLTLILSATGVSLGWVYSFMGILIGSAVVPITLCMSWGRVNSLGMMSGAILGCLFGLVSWLAVAATNYDGGLSKFFENTGKELSMLVGNVVAIGSGGLICITVSLITNRNYTSEMETTVWENTRDIDSPLGPWTEMYAKELNLSGANKLDNRPSLEEVAATFKGAKMVAYIGAIVLAVLLIGAWPASSSAIGVFTYDNFKIWVGVSVAWAGVGATFIIAMPMLNEIIEIRNTLAGKNKIDVVEGEIYATISEHWGSDRLKASASNVRNGDVKTAAAKYEPKPEIKEVPPEQEAAAVEETPAVIAADPAPAAATAENEAAGKEEENTNQNNSDPTHAHVSIISVSEPGHGGEETKEETRSSPTDPREAVFP